MADVSAGCSGGGTTMIARGTVTRPTAVPEPSGPELGGLHETRLPQTVPVPALGADTDSVLASLGIR
jgi:hypothetical protein